MRPLKEFCRRGHLMAETRKRLPCGETYCSSCSKQNNMERRVKYPNAPSLQKRTHPEGWKPRRRSSKYGVPCKIGGLNNPVYSKAYWHDNKERLQAQKREWRRTHSGKGRQSYYRPLVISLLYQRDGDRCGICGEVVALVDASIDHITQLAHGGRDEASNVRLTHLTCNLNRPKRRPEGVEENDTRSF